MTGVRPVDRSETAAGRSSEWGRRVPLVGHWWGRVVWDLFLIGLQVTAEGTGLNPNAECGKRFLPEVLMPLL